MSSVDGLFGLFHCCFRNEDDEMARLALESRGPALVFKRACWLGETCSANLPNVLLEKVSAPPVTSSKSSPAQQVATKNG